MFQPPLWCRSCISTSCVRAWLCVRAQYWVIYRVHGIRSVNVPPPLRFLHHFPWYFRPASFFSFAAWPRTQFSFVTFFSFTRQISPAIRCLDTVSRRKILMSRRKRVQLLRFTESIMWTVYSNQFTGVGHSSAGCTWAALRATVLHVLFWPGKRLL